MEYACWTVEEEFRRNTLPRDSGIFFARDGVSDGLRDSSKVEPKAKVRQKSFVQPARPLSSSSYPVNIPASNRLLRICTRMCSWELFDDDARCGADSGGKEEEAVWGRVHAVRQCPTRLYRRHRRRRSTFSGGPRDQLSSEAKFRLFRGCWCIGPELCLAFGQARLKSLVCRCLLED
jgi:hypothetical protein